ncbi:hypothetical protein ENC_24090 [Enterobacter hormaechei]|nr:hypothetical protein ENC_24090 [Enterobacter hormaechei]
MKLLKESRLKKYFAESTQADVNYHDKNCEQREQLMLSPIVFEKSLQEFVVIHRIQISYY